MLYITRIATVIYLFALSSSFALVIRTPDSTPPDRNDRFLNFSSSSISSNPEFIDADVDLTGVGWYVADTRRQFTMVSPKHFVGANHFKPSTNSSIRFLSSDGTVRTYAIGSTQSILNDAGEPTDLFIGTLEEAIAPTDGIQFQPYLNLATEGAYVGQSVIFLGKTARGGRGTINAFIDFGGDPITGGAGINETRTFQMVYNTIAGFSDDAHAEIGDSGSPSLVRSGGKAALVGTHTAVASVAGTITTFDTFVPHYIDELNEIMSAEGYHMTEASPAAVTLDLTATVPAIIRAGYPFTISFEFENTDLTKPVNNLRFKQVVSDAMTITSATGSGWVDNFPEDDLVSLRRGGLGANETTTVDVNLEALVAESFTSEVSFEADEWMLSTINVQLDVIESFLSWSSELSNATPDGDDDKDGVSNLLEYAFGGDPETASLEVEGTIEPLLPRVKISPDGSEIDIIYVRRTDFVDRALAYTIEGRSSLTTGNWTDASADIVATSSESLKPGFERVTQTLPFLSAIQFYRLAISLSE